jgi:polysaccharide export outer membrane protein
MYDPQVDIFVQEYRSRQVAVSGAVKTPGLYSLAGRTETLLNMVSLAGGLTTEASQQILLIPAEYGAHGKAAQHSPGQAIQPTDEAATSYALDSANPIRIDLTDLSKGGNPLSLSLPARPGDVIIVPGSGEVLVGGWVATPGSYKITPGLTVLGAVTAAGDSLYAADTHAVKVMRNGKAGESTFFIADLEKIKRGESPDIPVQDSDIIEVAASSARLVPYGFYKFFTSVFNTGASFRIN